MRIGTAFRLTGQEERAGSQGGNRMSTAATTTDTGSDSNRRQALLDSLDGLLGCTRVREIRYRLEMAESRANDLRSIDCPLGGRKHRGQTLYGEVIAALEQQAADLRAILAAAQARDEQDRYAHLASCLLEQALDELVLAIQAGTMTREAALALVRQARQAEDAIRTADRILDAIDAAENLPPRLDAALLHPQDPS